MGKKSYWSDEMERLYCEAVMLWDLKISLRVIEIFDKGTELYDLHFKRATYLLNYFHEGDTQL